MLKVCTEAIQSRESRVSGCHTTFTPAECARARLSVPSSHCCYLPNRIIQVRLSSLRDAQFQLFQTEAICHAGPPVLLQTAQG